ncbi:MAG: HgcAB-associated protein [Chloroflexi bacterium]|nr:HgcAB-associated protein [Chloroflexota bacterium]
MTTEDLRMVDEGGSTYKIEAVVSVDERGQMVLPKELRQRAGIGPGDKVALVAMNDASGALCCFSLFKVDDLSEMVRNKLQPVMEGASNS